MLMTEEKNIELNLELGLKKYFMSNFFKKLNNILEYGIYAFVFLLPIQTRLFLKDASLGGYVYEPGRISLYATDILLIILLFIFFLINYRTKKKGEALKKHNKYWWLIAGLEAVIVIGIFLAEDKLLAFYGYIRFLLGVSLFWLIIKARFSLEKLILVFITSVFLQTIFGIWQSLMQSSPHSKWLGLASHEAFSSGAAVIEVAGGGRWLRAYGFFDHPNIFGGVLAVALLFACFEILKYSLGGSKKMPLGDSKLETKIKEKINRINIPDNSLKMLVLLSVVSTLTVGLFFSFSRAAILGIFCSFIIILFLTIVKRDLLKQRRILEVILIFGCVFFIFYNVYNDLMSTRVSVNTRLEEKSVNERVESVKIAGGLWREHKLFGVGINNYGNAVQEKIPWDEGEYFMYQPVHNVYLLVLTEIGLAGLFFFVGILYYIFLNIFKKAFVSTGAYLKLPIFIFILILFMFDHWLWSLHFGVLFFWLLMGVMIRKDVA